MYVQLQDSVHILYNVALTPAFYLRIVCKIRPSDVKGKFWRRSSRQGVTKRCRLSWLTKSALLYEPKCRVSSMQWVYIQLHRSPKKFWRSNSIFNLWVQSSFAVVLFGCFPPSLSSIEAAFSLPSLVVFLLSVEQVYACLHSPATIRRQQKNLVFFPVIFSWDPKSDIMREAVRQ
jgi:hypothetical protein